MLDLDVTVLHALVGDEPSTVAGLLSTYARTIASAQPEAQRAFDARDAAGVQRAAHLVKSPSLCVGAIPLGRLCAELEDAARCGDWSRVEALWPLFEPALRATARAAQMHIGASAVLP